MPTKKLTALSIPTLAPGEWYDAVLPGLILRVGKKRRTWQFRYHAGGSYHRKPLGHFPAMELAAARDTARKLIDRADRGIPTEVAAPHPRASSALTLGGLLDKFEALRIKEGARTKALPEGMRLLRRGLGPYLSLPVTEFSKADLRAARDVLADAGKVISANRLLGWLSPVMRWGAQEDLIEVNFVSAIRRAPEVTRDRVLSKAEIKKVWNACGNLGKSEVVTNYGRMVRFLLITAQRRDEAASLRHGHILNGLWRQAENKASRPHSVPLPSRTLALVGQGEARELVFPGNSGSKITGWSYLKASLDKASGVTGWRLHDLRRTAASNMQELGARNEVVQLILNHAVPGVGGIYLRAEFEREKGEALARWANALARIVGPMRVTA